MSPLVIFTKQIWFVHYTIGLLLSSVRVGMMLKGRDDFLRYILLGLYLHLSFISKLEDLGHVLLNLIETSRSFFSAFLGVVVYRVVKNYKFFLLNSRKNPW